MQDRNGNVQNTVEMTLADEPFAKIKSGQKTLEIRLYDEKRRAIKKGDILVLCRSNSPTEQIRARVVALHPFNTFQELFESPLFFKTGCGDLTVDGAVQGMYRYYTRAQEETFGVLGIEIDPEI